MLSNSVRSALVMIAVSLVPVSAEATWSLSGVDRETDEVGIAGATCWSQIDRIGGLVPGVGVVAAQAWAWWEPWLRDRMVERLGEGASPQQAINTVVAEDPDSRLRQYGVVDLQGRTATFTGANVEQWRGSVRGTDVTVQGNTLPGSAVITRAHTAYQAAGGTLADKLLAGLEEGALAGGDARCPPGQAALSAFLRVARSSDTPSEPYINLVVGEQRHGGANPVTLLRQRYNEWLESGPLPKFAIGNKVRVIANPITSEPFVNVRATPGGAFLGTQPQNSTGTIIGGPHSAAVAGSGNPMVFVYWHINYDRGVDGWAGEILHSVVAAEPAAFATGNRVRVIANPITGESFVNVRATPGGAFLGTQPQNSTGTIIGGPHSAAVAGSGNPMVFVYWHINYDSGVDGWAGEIFHVVGGGS